MMDAAGSSGGEDLSFLDALLAETDDGDSCSLIAPLENGGARSSPSMRDREPVNNPVAAQSSTAHNGTVSTMRRWQREASRLWEERAKKIGTSTNESAAPKSNSWQRRKRDLQQLRDQVKQLEDELTARRAYATGSCLPPHSSEEHRQRLQRRQQYLNIAWKLAAEREKQLKSVSLCENARLKQLVERHSQLSRVLRVALFQQQQQQQQHEQQHQGTQRVVLSLAQQARLQNSAERSSLFIALEQKLEARLPLVEEIARHTCAPSKRPADRIEMNVNGGESVHPVGNIQRAKSFPFRVASVVDVMWRCAENGFREFTTSRNATIRLAEDSLGMDAECSLQQQGPNGPTLNFHVRGVLKRWVTDKRVLTQFACVTEWPSDMGLDSVTEEFAWTVARSSVGTLRRASALRDSAHTQSSIETTVVSPGSNRGSSNQARRELITNMVLPSLSIMMKRMDQIVENALLDSARAVSARTP